MLSKKFPLLILFLSIIAFHSCKNDDDENDSFYQQISNETLLWLSSYQIEDQEIVYINSTNDTTRLSIGYTNFSTGPTYIDCQRDGETVQCDYKTTSIRFPEEFDPANQKMALTIAAIANSDLRVMPTQSGLVVSAARLDVDTKELRTESDAHFSVSFSDSYSYNGKTYETITINTISTDNLATGGAVPPKKLVFAKEGGILTWDDYDGVTWDLVQ